MISHRNEFLFLTTGFLVALCIFVYKLGNTALLSYDEAWYGEISRNLVASKNPFLLAFNGKIFTDHPPLGFFLQAIPIVFWGSNEFSVRFTSAITGAGSLILMYLVGKKLQSRLAGIASAFILFSSLWFVARARSGNLDVPFIFLEILTVYLLLKKGSKWLYFASASFAALLLTKTLVGLGLLPVFLLAIWSRRKEWTSKMYLSATSLFGIILLPWYVVNQINDQNFLFHHFIEIGIRGENNVIGINALTQSFQYLAIGIGKWYKLFLLAIPLGIVLFWKRKKLRFSHTFLALWFVGFTPFLISSKTEIWHLLPLYPVVSLLISVSIFAVLDQIPLPFRRILKGGALVCFVGLAVFQFSQLSNLFYFSEMQFSSEKDISIKASKYNSIHLMETFYPAAVYYSQKNIDPLHWDPQAYQVMTHMLISGSKDVFIINKNIRESLEKDKIVFSILDQNSSYYLISAN